MAGMEISQHLAALDDDGGLLADAAERAGLDAVVPPCAPWQVRDLLRHTAYVHRWAAAHVAERRDKVIVGPPEREILGGGPADGDLVGWLREGHSALVETLRTADPDVRCVTFLGAPSPLAFWARRQAHETAIHRFDAQSAGCAVDAATAFGPGFAADGIDELVMGFGARGDYRLAEGRSLLVRATDTGDAWRIAPGEVRRGGGPADCEVRGTASALYLYLWNRCGAAAHVMIHGDPRVVEDWRSSMSVRWELPRRRVCSARD
jgi:uncharacterized protein (TIGR03083 family)